MWIELDPKDLDAFLEKLKPEDREKIEIYIEIYGVLEDGTIERIEEKQSFILVKESHRSVRVN